jgi:hypothetical protein
MEHWKTWLIKLPEPEIAQSASTRKLIIKSKKPKETFRKHKVSLPRTKKESKYLKDYLASDTKKQKYF